LSGEFNPKLDAANAGRRFGPHLAKDEGAELLGRDACGGAAVAVVLAGEAELPAQGGVLLGEAFLPAFPAEPADLLAERLAGLRRECADFAPGEFEPHRDDGPPAPDGTVFGRERENGLRTVGDGGHGKLRGGANRRAF
jgi:hypothetical protein